MDGISIKTLLSIGGKRWQKGSFDRIYFNDLASLYGLNIKERSNSGHIYSATLEGESISNHRATKIDSDLSVMKLWYDTITNTFQWQGTGPTLERFDGYARPIVAEIERRAAEWEVQHATD